MAKYWEDKNFELKNLKTWNRYPVKVNKDLINKVIKKSKRVYNPKHVEYTLNLLFSEMAQDFKNTELENLWFFDNFGSFKLKIYDKVVKLPNIRMIKYNCRSVRFAFAYNYKATAYKILNKDNQQVIDYLLEKRRNRVIARKIFGVNYAKNRD